MRKLSAILTFMIWANILRAQDIAPQDDRSETGFIIIGIGLLIVIILILYNRQKRKFND